MEYNMKNIRSYNSMLLNESLESFEVNVRKENIFDLRNEKTLAREWVYNEPIKVDSVQGEIVDERNLSITIELSNGSQIEYIVNDGEEQLDIDGLILEETKDYTGPIEISGGLIASLLDIFEKNYPEA